MKTLILACLTALCAIAYFRTIRFDSLDLTSDKHALSWDDITEDLWP